MQHYVKEALLGEGMFGVVYRARDKRSDTAVALKKSAFCRRIHSAFH